MLVKENKIRHLILSAEEYLREGADATEFIETIKLAAQDFFQSEEYQLRSVAYAWRAGQYFRRIKAQIRRGAFTAWKDNAGFASSRTIEMYMRIAKGYESAEEASDVGKTIVGADEVLRARRNAKKQGRILTKSEEAEVAEAARLGKNDKDISAEVTELELGTETYIHRADMNGLAVCGGDGLVFQKRLDAVNCPQCLSWVDRQENHYGNSQRNVYPSDSHLCDEYGITLKQWLAIFENQGRVCAICESENPRGEKWHTDHDHDTRRVRGVLCRNCNTSLGWFENRRQKILAYLDR